MHRIPNIRPFYTRSKQLLFDTLWRRRRRSGRVIVVLLALLLTWTSVSFGVAQWYIGKQRTQPLVIGASFIPSYARELGVDPQETLQAMIDELGIRRFRLVSYWKDHEKQPGTYDFSELDWQFEKIEQAGGSVALALGLRQPRWPECHGPEWAMQKSVSEWSKDLKRFMGMVIERYKDSPALVEYQLENEFHLSVFGECPDFSRDRLIDEYQFVTAQDPDTPIALSRSTNTPNIPTGEPRPDKVGISVYKRIWDKYLTKRYLEYPFPSWYYAALAGWGEIITGKPHFLHELQTEPWLPDGFSMKDAPIEELYKSFGPDRLQSRLKYAQGTGLRTIDLWGVEWWYQMKTVRGEPEIWNEATQLLADTY